MSTAAAPRAITVSEGLLRREAVDNAMADLRLEGLASTADARLLFEQFVQGELTEEQLVNAISPAALSAQIETIWNGQYVIFITEGPFKDNWFSHE